MLLALRFWRALALLMSHTLVVVSKRIAGTSVTRANYTTSSGFAAVVLASGSRRRYGSYEDEVASKCRIRDQTTLSNACGNIMPQSEDCHKCMACESEHCMALINRCDDFLAIAFSQCDVSTCDWTWAVGLSVFGVGACCVCACIWNAGKSWSAAHPCSEDDALAASPAYKWMNLDFRGLREQRVVAKSGRDGCPSELQLAGWAHPDEATGGTPEYCTYLWKFDDGGGISGSCERGSQEVRVLGKLIPMNRGFLLPGPWEVKWSELKGGMEMEAFGTLTRPAEDMFKLQAKYLQDTNDMYEKGEMFLSGSPENLMPQVVGLPVAQNGFCEKNAVRGHCSRNDVELGLQPESKAPSGPAAAAAAEKITEPEEVWNAALAVDYEGFLFQFAPESLRRNRTVVLEAVARSGVALAGAADKLRADRQVILAAVQQNGAALCFAQKELKADREIAMAAVRQTGFALLHVSQELRSDRSVVLEAVKESGRALIYASEMLRCDRDVVLAAVKQDPEALQYASGDLREALEAERIMSFP
eukprot:TRINITY_DN36789_c0_g1_i1.p1 TRINITY_DN36789_c0_g1~~TRINITY_DN36789_c0_g1_i1.p1  ORF type:complete len:531 (+),score=109.36 TRINITY_DN36789_c0_g1_i1:56-1648(+)